LAHRLIRRLAHGVHVAQTPVVVFVIFATRMTLSLPRIHFVVVAKGIDVCLPALAD
jgi:hypothetical protein